MSVSRLLILGASGLLGYSVSNAATRATGTELHLAVGRGRAPDIPGAVLHRLDLRDLAATYEWLVGLRPDFVINCAGIVKSACDDGYQAALVNSALPHMVSSALRPTGGRLLHISTDCVFSGNLGGYLESDLPDPLDLYGRTKLAGEVLDDPHLTIRTSFVGLEQDRPRGLLGWFLAQTGTVPGFRKAIWSGLTTDVLAEVLLSLIGRREITGLLHVAGDPIDKFALLSLAAEVFGKFDVRVQPVDQPVCDRSLRSERLATLGIRIPSVRMMLEGLKRDEGCYAKRI